MFRIKKSTDGQFYFVLVARNGQTLATSETYTKRGKCIEGITAVCLRLDGFNPKHPIIVDETRDN